MSVTGFYTDTAVVDVFPTAAGLTTDERRQAALDATAVYDYAAINKGVSEVDLRGWGEQQGIYPARMNIALGLLQDSGKLFTLPQAGPIDSAQASADSGAVALRGGAAETPAAAPGFPAEHLTVAELRRVARRAGAEVKASATKEELIEAIVATCTRG